MRPVQILGTGGHLPGDPIDNATLERLVGPLPDDVMEGISIQQRFWMTDPFTGAHRENNSDMAYTAARMALESANVDAGEIDLMILATGTPDYHLPPVVNFVQDRLGIGQCATMELRSGGAGVVQGLDIAKMYLERGVYKTALVIGSETISPVLIPVYLGKSPDAVRMRERMPLYMFGDGAGAMVLRAGEEGAPGIVGAAQACVGGGKKPGIHAVGGGTHAPIAEQLKARRLVDLRVDVLEAGKFTPYMITQAIGETLRRSGVGVQEIDLCLIPEGNVGWMLDSMEEGGLTTADWAALDGKIFDNLAQSGATGCAAVPLFLDHAWRHGQVKPGDRIMLVGLESTKWIYAGAVVDWTAP
ncbi:MAG TPA: 3-oxoacyl-[acyl-carrier-protein] synthase III C-terminal domain-containing protein, partial [Sphingomicrobium sp.]|nr:3-oxoacyl-[acyl-carrier-protein] synthase III C-terminal domain-containing protein [Sphingomicrobium sp.]